MPTIICYRCFARIAPSEVHFKCIMHSDGPHIFPWKGHRWRRRLPRNAVCPEDLLLTGFRICPNCRADLPYFVGDMPQNIVAVTGCRGTGKTIYLWSLLHRLLEELSRDPQPFAVALFEDDTSFSVYHKLSISLLVDREVPEATQAEEMKEGNATPVIVRVLLGCDRQTFCNLIFYDPAGELIENLDDVRYLRYLASSAAIIYLLEPPAGRDAAEDDARATTASEGLGGIIRQIRHELGLSTDQTIRKTLAVAITKADEDVFPCQGIDRLVAGRGRSQEFWHRWTGDNIAEMDRASGCCEKLLRSWGYNDLVNKGNLNFESVRYFALSSLGASPKAGRLAGRPQPVGVENPLFWILHSLL